MIKFITQYYKKRKTVKKLENTISTLLGFGTAIASFEYHGKVRNVTIGANIEKALEKRGFSVGGGRASNLKKINRALYKNNKGRVMLRALVQNDDSAPIKNFFLDEIENFTHNRVVYK